MFRELLKKNKQITNDECIEVLINETRGVLSVNGDDGYPYGMPMNHFYNADDGCIYFHCARNGHRVDSLKKSDKSSFCVCEKGSRIDSEWALTVRSVIVFGRVEIIDDLDKVIDICTKLSYKFTNDAEYINQEIKLYADAAILLKLTPEHICGKRVNES